DRVRRLLRERVGIDVGAALQDVERSILSIEGTSHRLHTQPVRGRDTELDRIVDTARSGGRAVVIADDGLGKSTVVGEVARRLRAAGLRVATAAGHETPAQPLPVLTELLTELGASAEYALGPIDGF